MRLILLLLLSSCGISDFVDKQEVQILIDKANQGKICFDVLGTNGSIGRYCINNVALERKK